jgi:hypothetical protein
MTFVPVWFTGFENGLVPEPTGWTSANSGGKTGSFYGSVTNSAASDVRATLWSLSSPFPQSDFYFGSWIYDVRQTSAAELRFNLSDGNILYVRNEGNRYNGYINSTLVGSGSINIDPNTWRHIQVHISITDSDGIFECLIDGSPNFSYIGDTKPAAATTVTNMSVVNLIANWIQPVGFYFDDMVVGTDGWPGDLRVDAMLPSADTATAEWTASTGGTNYECVDEVPPSNSNYISTTITGKRTILELGDFNATNKTPLALKVHARLAKSNAVTDTIKYGVISGGGTEQTVEQTVTTVFADYSTMLLLNPDGNIPWTDGSLDALKIVIESVVT